MLEICLWQLVKIPVELNWKSYSVFWANMGSSKNLGRATFRKMPEAGLKIAQKGLKNTFFVKILPRHLVWLGYFGFWGSKPSRPPTRMYGFEYFLDHLPSETIFQIFQITNPLVLKFQGYYQDVSLLFDKFASETTFY